MCVYILRIAVTISCAAICSTGVLIRLLLVVRNSSILGACAILEACSQVGLCIGRIDWPFTVKDGLGSLVIE